MDNMTAAAVPMTIQDYIIDISAANQKNIKYELVLENNTDFIVRRETAKLQKELVILISQGLYYIRNCKDGSIDPVTEVTLRSFLRDMKDSAIRLEKVHWLSALCKEACGYILTVIEDADVAEMCRHNVPIIPDDPRRYLQYWQQNKKLLIRLSQIFPQDGIAAEKYRACLPAIFWIERTMGTNEALYFSDKLVQSGVRRISLSGYHHYHDNNGNFDSFQRIITSEFHINFRRFIDYICFDLYRQGYGEVNGTFFREYYDYLSMQKQLFGKIREKYPEHFKTEHDVMALKINLANTAAQCENFAQQSERIKDMEYSSQGYCIVVPTEPRELADEGINLSHCVGDYIDRVASGECHILFLRRRATPDRSLVTLQLSGNRICQAQGLNRRNITKEERKFLMRWGGEKKIEIAV